MNDRRTQEKTQSKSSLNFAVKKPKIPFTKLEILINFEKDTLLQMA